LLGDREQRQRHADPDQPQQRHPGPVLAVDRAACRWRRGERGRVQPDTGQGDQAGLQGLQPDVDEQERGSPDEGGAGQQQPLLGAEGAGPGAGAGLQQRPAAVRLVDAAQLLAGGSQLGGDGMGGAGSVGVHQVAGIAGPPTARISDVLGHPTPARHLYRAGLPPAPITKGHSPPYQPAGSRAATCSSAASGAGAGDPRPGRPARPAPPPTTAAAAAPGGWSDRPDTRR
jgi:hypothetical protein